MSHRIFNPKQSDYAGQFRLGIMALLVGVVFLVVGLGLQSGFFNTILVSLGVGLVIGGGAVILSAKRSKDRAEATRDE